MNNLLQQIVPIIVFIAMVMGVINSIRESMAAKAKKQNALPEAKKSRAQSEIAAFLGGAAAQPQRTQVPQQQKAESQRPKQKQRQKTQRSAQGDATPKQSSKQKHERPMGSGLRDHVESYIGDHVKSHMGRDVDAHVKKEIDERVKSHLGSQSSQAVEMSGKPANEHAATDLLKALKSPEGVRQAIMVHEVLSRPRALRR